MARFSTCEKRKVGAVIVDGNTGRTLANGRNGTLAGHSNCCEDENGKNLPGTLHAETNAINNLKALDLSVYSDNLHLFVTTAPCADCAKAMRWYNTHSGLTFTKVFYIRSYKNNDGLILLQDNGVLLVRLNEKQLNDFIEKGVPVDDEIS